MTRAPGQSRRTSGRACAGGLLQASGGAVMVEWALLLAAIGIPSIVLIRAALNLLVEYYRMMSLLNSLPFP